MALRPGNPGFQSGFSPTAHPDSGSKPPPISLESPGSNRFHGDLKGLGEPHRAEIRVSDPEIGADSVSSADTVENGLPGRKDRVSQNDSKYAKQPLPPSRVLTQTEVTSNAVELPMAAHRVHEIMSPPRAESAPAIPHEPRWLTLQEAATRWRCSPRTVVRHLRRLGLRPLRLGRVMRIDIVAVEMVATKQELP